MRRSPLVMSLVALTAAACTPSATAPPPLPPTPPAPVATTSPVLARPLEAVAATPAPSFPPTLTVLFEGSCPKARVGHVGSSPAFVHPQNVVYFEGDEPRELYRMDAKSQRDPYGAGHVGILGEVGGSDAAHAWVVQHLPSRGEGTADGVLFAARSWKNTQYAKGEAATSYHANGVIENSDGSVWSFATESWDGDGSTNHFVAWSASGDLLEVHLPKGDMRGARRMGSGELVVGGYGKKGPLQLRRWSPTRPVNDLVTPDRLLGQTQVDTLVGNSRAVMVTEGPVGKLAFYSYQNDALKRLALARPASPADTWLLTQDDDFYVAHGAEIDVYPRDGEARRLTVPEPGALAQDPLHVWWQAKSGALYALDAQAPSGWSRIELPASPWSVPERGPTTIEYVKTVGTETVVGTRHSEPGKTKKSKTVTIRTVYSAVAHGEPARCGAPLRSGEVGRPATAAR